MRPLRTRVSCAETRPAPESRFDELRGSIRILSSDISAPAQLVRIGLITSNLSLFFVLFFGGWGVSFVELQYFHHSNSLHFNLVELKYICFDHDVYLRRREKTVPSFSIIRSAT